MQAGGVLSTIGMALAEEYRVVEMTYVACQWQIVCSPLCVYIGYVVASATGVIRRRNGFPSFDPPRAVGRVMELGSSSSTAGGDENAASDGSGM